MPPRETPPPETLAELHALRERVAALEAQLVGTRAAVVAVAPVRDGDEDTDESDAIYARLVEGSPDGIVIHREGRIVFANATAAQLAGAPSARALVGHRLMEFVHPEFRGFVADRVRRMVEEGEDVPLTAERFLRLDGIPFDADVRAGPITFGGRPAVQVVFRDARPRLEAEESLRYRLRFEKLLTEISTHFINLPHEETDAGIVRALGETGRFAGVDLGYVQLFAPDGLTMDVTHAWTADGAPPPNTPLAGKPLALFPWAIARLKRREILHVPRLDELPAEASSDRANWERIGFRSIVSAPLVCGEAVVGFVGFASLHEMPWTDDAIALLKVLAEIVANALQHQQSERTQAHVEEQLRRSADRLEALRDIDRGILAARSPEELAHAVLTHIRRLVPCSRTTVTVRLHDGGTWVPLAAQAHNGCADPARAPQPLPPPPEGKEGAIAVVEDALDPAAGGVLAAALAAEGLRGYLHVPLVVGGATIGVLQVARRAPGAFVAEHIDIARDVADMLAVAIHQARLGAELRAYADELERRVEERTRELQDNNAELESFSYSVSHDLRAPLRAMKGFAELLEDEYGAALDETGRDYASRIVKAARRMEQLISDLLAYSRVSRGSLSLEAVSLAKVVTTALEEYEPMFRERGAVVTVEEALPNVVGHAPTLLVVVENLLANAVKFVAPGVTPRVTVRTVAQGGCVRLVVEDNGIGIDPRYQERIFQVFERLHAGDSYPGTGIGLAIVRRAVTRMGGHVGVESEPGAGSRFWIELPAPPSHPGE